MAAETDRGVVRCRYARPAWCWRFRSACGQQFQDRWTGERWRTSCAGLLRREAVTTFPHCVFACRPVAVIAPRLIVGLRPLSRKLPPCRLEIGARLVERVGSAVGLLARLRARIEAAHPLPSFGGSGIADALCDGADMDIAEIDIPAVLAFRVAAAGELGHSALKRGRPGHGKPLTDCGGRHEEHNGANDRVPYCRNPFGKKGQICNLNRNHRLHR